MEITGQQIRSALESNPTLTLLKVWPPRPPVGRHGTSGKPQEMGAWFALTRGDYLGMLNTAMIGLAVAPHSGASVQLHAQAAKAWTRLGDRRQVDTALDRLETDGQRTGARVSTTNHVAKS